MSHSKFQESNALAEISKLLKQQQQSAPAERLVVETKKIEEVKEVSAPAHKVPAEAKKIKRKKEFPAEAPQVPIDPPVAAAAPPQPDGDDGDVYSQFQEWHVSNMADYFVTELDNLQESDVPIPPGVALRSLAASAALFNATEQRLAAAGGTQPGT